MIKQLRQKCFNLEIENENLVKLVTDLIDITAELDKRVLSLEDSSLTREVFNIKGVELERRLSKLENVSQDTNRIETGGTLVSWVDMVNKRTTDLNDLHPTPLPEIQTKIMTSEMVD